jgi:hypothetical protein
MGLALMAYLLVPPSGNVWRLITKGILQKEPGGGRSSAYTLTEPK